MAFTTRRAWWPHLDAPGLLTDYTLDDPPDHDPGIRDMIVGAARPSRAAFAPGRNPGGATPSDLTAPPSAVSRTRDAHNPAPTPPNRKDT